MQELHNCLGLPPDTPGRDVLKQGKEHYLFLASDYLNAYVEAVLDEGETFAVKVCGHNLHACLICDGYEMRDQRVGVFGSSEDSLQVAFPLGWFTPHITLFTNGAFEVEQELRDRFTAAGYTLNEQPVRQFLGDRHQMSGVELADASIVELDAGVVSMGSKYHADYLKDIDLELNRCGRSRVNWPLPPKHYPACCHACKLKASSSVRWHDSP